MHKSHWLLLENNLKKKNQQGAAHHNKNNSNETNVVQKLSQRHELTGLNQRSFNEYKEPRDKDHNHF